VSLALVFGHDDAARVRFAISPAWETQAAVRVLLEPQLRAYHLPWLDSVRAGLDQLELWPLLVLSPRRGWTPDFLSPTPAGPSTDIADQLAQIRATPPEQVAQEVRRSLTQRSGEPAPEAAWPRSSTRPPGRHLSTLPGESLSCGNQPPHVSPKRWGACSARPGPPCWNRSPNQPRRTLWPGGTSLPPAPSPNT